MLTFGTPQNKMYSQHEESCVGKQEREALRKLRQNIRKNAPLVRSKLSKSGIRPDTAIVYSMAKYYPALKRLAKE